MYSKAKGDFLSIVWSSSTIIRKRIISSLNCIHFHFLNLDSIAGVSAFKTLQMGAENPGPTYWEGAPPSSVLGVGAKVPSSLFGVGSLLALGPYARCHIIYSILQTMRYNCVTPHTLAHILHNLITAIHTSVCNYIWYSYYWIATTWFVISDTFLITIPSCSTILMLILSVFLSTFNYFHY